MSPESLKSIGNQQMNPRFAKHMEAVDKYIDRLTNNEEGNVSLISKGDEIIPLGVIYTLFNDILKRPNRFSMSDFIESFFYRYCDMEVKGIPRNFLFRLEGKELLYQVNYDKALSYEGEVILLNKALRYYLCNMFSGINANLNMLPYKDADFYLTFNGRELLVKPIQKVNVND